jgi:hypothetical protein
MTHIDLLWQVPAIFTAVPMVHRLLPFKLAARAIPLFYAVISWLVMAMPDRIDLGLAAAGLVTLLHNRVGLSLSTEQPADLAVAKTWLRETYASISGLLVLGYEWVAATRPAVQDETVHDDDEDGKSEHEKFPDPPKPPPGNVPQRIPRL